MRHVAHPSDGTERLEGWPRESTRIAQCTGCGRRIIRQQDTWRHARSRTRRALLAAALGAASIGVGMVVGVLVADPETDRLLVALALTLACVIAVLVAGPRVTAE